MKVDPEAFFLQMGQLVSAMPELHGDGWATPEGRMWLGRAAALVHAAGNYADMAMFNVASDNLGGTLHTANANTIISIVYRTLGAAELAAPAALRGQFIAAGDTLSAFAGVAQVFSRAKQDLLLVDKYADASVITDFIVTAPDDVTVRILGADKESRKAALRPAVERYQNQMGASRPLLVRVAPSQSLHDRLIFVDKKEAWTLGQSFNGLAQRSHSYIMRASPDIEAEKLAAYQAMWDAAAALP